MHISREKGFTLLELLASIVLIGIIFTALFHFLGQNIFMSASVENQYVTAQIAERELEENRFASLSLPSNYVPGNEEVFNYTVESRGKEYQITVSLRAENEEEFDAGLFRLRVKAEEPESGRASVAYGWYTEKIGGVE
ncbi:type IV pilus modification PilV family protein [Salisediminibacterium selenitireducens]|uniref:Prepilin-type N-terminal cleavage/methylation domain-containing protein n=1 Tax=Bacillus selenitireducens (strain ATCC 700615 / DSM 15326 / MLS10) TaxID=439292 RepID=D6Y0C9_BACIE|nr:type II secretion system protein [Salisediminibacterium selenitireducens]ADH98520.1 hypothetical protein Bsel_0999 [[Bacillus] selenitireducens MLS10]